MATTQIIRITLQVWGSIACLLIFACLHFTGRFQNPTGRAYRNLLLIHTAAALFDIAAPFLAQTNDPRAASALLFTCTAATACSLLAIPAAIHWLAHHLKSCDPQQDDKCVRTALLFTGTACALTAIALLANLRHGFLFHIGASNLYIHGPWYILPDLVSLLGVLTGMGLIFRCSIPGKYALVSCLTLPLTFIFLHILIPEMDFTIPGNTLTLLCLWLLTGQSGQSVGHPTEQQECTEAIIRQINPHFLFNALNAIQYLCRTDTRQASHTVNVFAQYLRTTLEALTRTSPITLQEDLDHLDRYLDIEHLRFPDITFLFDLKAMDFSLPPLTLQPLAESAIRGVRQLQEGGVITFSSWEQADAFHLQVSDNSGITQEHPPDAAPLSPSLSHTRARIETMCHGQMEIKARPGQGVTVHIRIPKEEI